MLSKTRPSRVQALSKRVQTPHFYVQAWEIRFQKYCKKQHGLVQAFRPTGLFIILKGRTTPMPVLRGLRLLDDAQISPLLEFYLRLLRFWFLTHSKSRQQPSPHCFREGRVLPGFGNRTPASTLNFLFWPMTLSIIAFITIIVISVYFFVYCLLLVVISLARSLSRSLALARSLSLALSRSLARSLSLARSRSRSLALARSRSRSRTLPRSLALAHSLARSLSRSLALARSLSLARARSLSRSLVLARSFALSLALARSLVLARSFARSLSLAPSLVLARSGSRSLSLSLARSLSLALARSLARSLALARFDSQSHPERYPLALCIQGR